MLSEPRPDLQIELPNRPMRTSVALAPDAALLSLVLSGTGSGDDRTATLLADRFGDLARS